MAKRKYDPKKFSKALGLRIRQLRTDCGWTLEDCEEHSDLNWTHLQRVESGKNITLATLVAIANLFGMSPAELLDL